MESYLWLSGSGVDTDVHAAFRFTFSTENPNEKLSIHHLGISWYNVYVDGNYVAEGPTRFIGNTPYYDETEITIPTAGKHVVAVHAHSCGEQTRILLKTPPLVWVGIYNAAKELVKIDSSKCYNLSSAVYQSQWKRMSVLLGWMENATLSKLTATWMLPTFDDSTWASPVAAAAASTLQPPVRLSLTASGASSVAGPVTEMDTGTLWETYGYANDDPHARLILRKLVRATRADGVVTAGNAIDYGPPQGKFWRYDAGTDGQGGCNVIDGGVREDHMPSNVSWGSAVWMRNAVRKSCVWI
eukprot:m.1343431 g.1343431  ORF g.1343431 m.1343431 type:complete len:299 (-) comp24901_c1_seq31:2074-2970(-)